MPGRQKSESASGQLIKRIEDLRELYLDEIFNYCWRRLGNIDDAEDATADTFQAAFRGFPPKKGWDPKLWLFGIARKKVFKHLKKRNRNVFSLQSHESDSIPLPADDQRDSDLNLLLELIETLPPMQKDVLLLYYIEGLQIKEIAKVIGKRPTAVNSLLQRARKSLQVAGADDFGEPPPSRLNHP